jgi:transposase
MSKYGDHLPLYRQSQIYAREGVDLDRSTLADWVGATSALLAPLLEALAKHVLSAYALHADDTPVPVLAPGTGKTKTGRLWTYVRDERPWGGSGEPAVLFRYSPDRKGEHPCVHLHSFSGVLHADGYAGFDQLYRPGRITEAACWAHVRRKFFDVHAANGSPTAKEALERIGKLYEIEKDINGLLPDHRRRERQQRSKPIAAALAAWADEIRRKLSRKSELAAAFRYMRARWTALNRCFDDGRLALDNNPAERALRCVAIGRKNYLFAGSDAGGRRDNPEAAELLEVGEVAQQIRHAEAMKRHGIDAVVCRDPAQTRRRYFVSNRPDRAVKVGDGRFGSRVAGKPVRADDAHHLSRANIEVHDTDVYEDYKQMSSDSAAKSPGASFARTSDADETANTRKSANAKRRAR